MVSQSDGVLGTVTSTYDLAGRRTRLSWSSSVFACYSYDVTGNLLSLQPPSGTSCGSNMIAHSYDSLGRRTGTTRANGVSSSYGYDAMGRMTSLAHDGAGSGQDVTFTLGYNPAGQIYARDVSNSAYVYQPVTSPNTTSYSHDDRNRLTAVNGGAVTSDEDFQITSALGNTTTYDSEGNLASVAAGGSTLSLVTDPVGRLYTSTLGSSVKRYLYDGFQVVGDYPSASSTTLAFRHVPGGSMIGQTPNASSCVIFGRMKKEHIGNRNKTCT